MGFEPWPCQCWKLFCKLALGGLDVGKEIALILVVKRFRIRKEQSGVTQCQSRNKWVAECSDPLKKASDIILHHRQPQNKRKKLHKLPWKCVAGIVLL